MYGQRKKKSFIFIFFNQGKSLSASHKPPSIEKKKEMIC